MKLLLSILLLIAVSGRGQQFKTETVIKGDTTFVRHLSATITYMTLPPQYGSYVVIYTDTTINAGIVLGQTTTPTISNNQTAQTTTASYDYLKSIGFYDAPKAVFNEPYQIPGIVNLTDTINIADYGAVPGGFDNAPLIKKLIDRNNGKLIWVPAGQFYFSKITINAGSNITIKGVGKLVAMDSIKVGEHILQLENLNNVNVDRLVFDGNMSKTIGNHNEGITLIKIWNCSNVTISNCTFQNNNYIAAGIRNSNNVVINNCQFNYTDVGVLTQGGNQVVSVINCGFVGGTSEGVSIWGQSDTVEDSFIYIYHNTVIGKSLSSAFHVRYGNNVHILDNAADNCKNGFGTEKNAPDYITVTGNTFTNCARGISANARFSLFVNNHISNCSGSGVWIGKDTFSTGNYISGNTITDVNSGNTGDDGIRITRSMSTIVSNNAIRETRLQPFNFCGVRVSGKECRNVTVSNNIIDRTVSDGKVIVEKGAVGTILTGQLGKVITYQVVR